MLKKKNEIPHEELGDKVTNRKLEKLDKDYLKSDKL